MGLVRTWLYSLLGTKPQHDALQKLKLMRIEHGLVEMGEHAGSR